MKAKSRNCTDLKRKLKNETPWTSTFKTLKLHVHLCSILAQITDESYDEFFLSVATERMVDVLLTELSELDDVVTNRQANDCTVRKAQVYFESVLEA